MDPDGGRCFFGTMMAVVAGSGEVPGAGRGNGLAHAWGGGFPRASAREALHEYLGELTSVCSAHVEGGAVHEDEGDPFRCRRTAQLATVAACAREEDGDCKPHRWHVYQVLHQYLAAVDRWPRAHRPFLAARAMHARRAMRPREAAE